MPSPFHYSNFTKFTIFSAFAGYSFIINELTTYWLFLLLFHTQLILFGLGVVARPLIRVFLSYFTGFLSDKYNRAKLFYMTRGTAAALLFPLTLAFVLKDISLIFILYYLRVFIVELSNTIGYVAYYASVPEEVRPKAILYIRIISMGSRLAGGASWFFLYQLLHAYNLMLVGFLGIMGLVFLRGFEIGGGSKRVRLTTGINIFRKDERVRGIILTYSVTDALTYSINYLLPLLVVVLHGTDQIYGLTQVFYYAIFIIASLIMTKLHNSTKIMVMYILSGFLLYLVLLYPSPYVLLISISLDSFGSGIIENFVMATITQSVGKEFLGSVLGLETFVTSITEIGIIFLAEYLISINVMYYVIMGVIGMSGVLIAWLLHPKLREIKL